MKNIKIALSLLLCFGGVVPSEKLYGQDKGIVLQIIDEVIVSETPCCYIFNAEKSSFGRNLSTATFSLYSMIASRANIEFSNSFRTNNYSLKIMDEYNQFYSKWFTLYKKKDAHKIIRFILIVFTFTFIISIVFIWLLRNQVQRATRKLSKKNQEMVELVDQLKEENYKRMEVEENLIKAKQKAEESDHLKSAFLANMSHEIRTPLNAIVGFSELLQETDDQSEKKEYMAIINKNNEMLLKLIGDILDLSKIQSNSIQLNPETFDFKSFLEELLYTMKSHSKNPEVELILHNPFRQFVVTLDKNRCLQIVTNYLSNALKFTEKGYVKLSYDYQEEGVLLCVEDTGKGIPKEHMGLVFQRFEKIDYFVQGSGLGLSICKELAKAMGGRVWAKSTLGKGSTFYLWLPCKADFQN